MLGTPMMLHAIGHLELMYIGLLAPALSRGVRMRLPGLACRGGILVVTGLLYLLMVMGAAYFAVLAVIPAVLYVVYKGRWRETGGTVGPGYWSRGVLVRCALQRWSCRASCCSS